MNQACEICRGACCESIVFVVPDTDEGRWLSLHGKLIGGGKAQIEVACSALVAGNCSIWKDRPLLCQAYAVGGDACRETVKRRRLNWQEIFEEMPPR